MIETVHRAFLKDLVCPNELLFRQLFPVRFHHADIEDEASDKPVELIVLFAPLGKREPVIGGRVSKRDINRTRRRWRLERRG